ncbi:NAD-dependent protein deacetylase sirtuin-2-like isoform X2 [Lingula anatina]|nr:NAD-dependent protein deacetylase sirtuin-2-like isoform X2 [Lingula anatina]|eukprot:XP_013410275.1 NAD-dependent protein deacetylase sirtuin-2-like isoform X2 [Lingula anatina]
MEHILKSFQDFAVSDEAPPQVLEEVSFEGIVKYIKSGKCKNIITMTGAGISTSAGIPDFRSPGTGLYDNLQKYDLPSPQAIFEIGYFKENPVPFFTLARELWPGSFKPTPCHYFLRLLHEKDLLLRAFTQNIDTLERVAGVPEEKLVEAHGTFATSHCVDCRQKYSQEWIKEKIFAGKDSVPTCEKEDCNGLVKPDIVFFGESLPSLFIERVGKDLPKCDLLIVMGTSLKVQPFASLVSRVDPSCPRLLINLESPPCGGDPFMLLFGLGTDFDFESERKYRDVFKQTTCDEGCFELADQLGWGEELRTLVKSEHERIDKKKTNVTEEAPTKSSSKSPQKKSKF